MNVSRTAWWILGVTVVTGGCGKKVPEKTESQTELVASGSAEVTSPASASSVAVAPKPPIGGEDMCKHVCARASGLGCGTLEECLEACTKMRAMPVCRKEIDVFFQCLASEPTEHWECDRSGFPSIAEGYCEEEQHAFFDCLDASGLGRKEDEERK